MPWPNFTGLDAIETSEYEQKNGTTNSFRVDLSGLCRIPVLFVGRCLNHYVADRKTSMTKLRVTAVCFPYSRNCAESYTSCPFTQFVSHWKAGSSLQVTTGLTTLSEQESEKSLLPHPFQRSKNSGFLFFFFNTD